MFLLLIPIPQALAIDMPRELDCQYFAASRRGWGCARYGNFTEQLTATGSAILVSVLCGTWINRSVGVPIRAVLLLAWGLFWGLAGLLGICYFLLGHAQPIYGAFSILGLFIAACSYLLLRRIPRKSFVSSPVDPERKNRMDREISIEITARQAEKRNAKHGGPQA
ncbi:MAG: hypothetical protein K2Q07_10005 [Burkholderiaceae bacterium]|nr:hypothetical protein [Burkholderiaceae bacterium]